MAKSQHLSAPPTRLTTTPHTPHPTPHTPQGKVAEGGAGVGADGKIDVTKGDLIALTSDPAAAEACDASRLWTTYDRLSEKLKPGSTVLLDDGAVELTVVESAEGTAGDGSGNLGDVLCRVENSGKIGSRKGVVGFEGAGSEQREAQLTEIPFCTCARARRCALVRPPAPPSLTLDRTSRASTQSSRQ